MGTRTLRERLEPTERRSDVARCEACDRPWQYSGAAGRMDAAMHENCRIREENGRVRFARRVYHPAPDQYELPLERGGEGQS